MGVCREMILHILKVLNHYVSFTFHGPELGGSCDLSPEDVIDLMEDPKKLIDKKRTKLNLP